MRKLPFVLIPLALILMSCGQAPVAASAQVPGGWILTAAAATLTARPTPNTADRQISDPSQVIEVNAGSEFHITVETNLTPDYHWELAEALDPKIVRYTWKDQTPQDSNNPGASGRDIWRFKAMAPGKATITLGYYQGMTVNSAKMLTFTVVVK